MKTSPNILQYHDYPGIGEVLQTNTPHRMGNTFSMLDDAREPSVLGADTERIFQELGIDQEAVDRLADEKKIVCADRI